MSLSQILAAMMQSSGQAPQVTPMGAAPSAGGGGGGVAPIKGNFRMPQQRPKQETLVDRVYPEFKQYEDLGYADPTPLIRQLTDAYNYADVMNNPSSFKEYRESKQGGKKEAMERIAQAQANIQDFQAQKAAEASMRQRENLAATTASTVFEMTGDEGMAMQLGQLMVTRPEAATQIINQMAQQKYPEPKAGTTINLPPEFPKPPAGHWWADPEAASKGDYSAGIVNLADVPKEAERRSEVLDSAALITKHTSNIRRQLDEATLPTTGFGGAVVRKATQMLDDPTGEGDVGKFTRFTAAGEIDALLEPIKSKIGLQTINQMRKMSETGGALGNVSNFEVRVVQAAIDSLDPNRGEEAFRSALDNVDTAFARAAFVARWGEDVIREARELGVDETAHLQEALNERYPINESFMDEINLNSEYHDQLDRDRKKETGNDEAPPENARGVYNPETGQIEWQ